MTNAGLSFARKPSNSRCTAPKEIRITWESKKMHLDYPVNFGTWIPNLLQFLNQAEKEGLISGSKPLQEQANNKCKTHVGGTKSSPKVQGQEKKSSFQAETEGLTLGSKPDYQAGQRSAEVFRVKFRGSILQRKRKPLTTARNVTSVTWSAKQGCIPSCGGKLTKTWSATQGSVTSCGDNLSKNGMATQGNVTSCGGNLSKNGMATQGNFTSCDCNRTKNWIDKQCSIPSCVNLPENISKIRHKENLNTNGLNHPHTSEHIMKYSSSRCGELKHSIANRESGSFRAPFPMISRKRRAVYSKRKDGTFVTWCINKAIPSAGQLRHEHHNCTHLLTDATSKEVPCSKTEAMVPVYNSTGNCGRNKKSCQCRSLNFNATQSGEKSNRKEDTFKHCLQENFRSDQMSENTSKEIPGALKRKISTTELKLTDPQNETVHSKRNKQTKELEPNDLPNETTPTERNEPKEEMKLTDLQNETNSSETKQNCRCCTYTSSLRCSPRSNTSHSTIADSGEGKSVFCSPIAPAFAAVHKPDFKHLHPAPLPIPCGRLLPQDDKQTASLPRPQLSSALQHNGILLSWVIPDGYNNDDISTYILYAYRESAALPTEKLWKKAGVVKAVKCPMYCLLTKLQRGHTYHFAVQSADIFRVSSFSNPCTVHLAKS